MQDNTLPDGWKRVTVDDIKAPEKGSVVSGPFGSNIGKRFFVDEGVPVIRGNNLTRGDKKFIDDGFVFVTEEKAYELRNCKAIAGDIVFTAAGTLGQVGLIPENTRYPEYIVSNKQLRLRCNVEIAYPDYLYYWFSSPDMRDYITNQNTGASIPLITLGTLRSLPVNLPPLPTQRRIASILSAYDDLIENSTRRIKILEQMAQALYREWFVEFRAPGVKLRQATSEEQKVTGKDRFPVGWELKQLGDIAQEVRRGAQPDQIDPETPYFGLEHLPRKSIALSDWGTASEVQSTKLAFKKGEILFGKIRPYFHKVGVAPIDGVCSSDTIVIVPNSPEYFALTLACVSSEDFVTHATQTSQGTKMPRANWDVLVKYGIPMPPEPLLRQFNALIQDIVGLIINMVFRNRNLRQTRDLLLPRLVSGEVNVENIAVEV